MNKVNYNREMEELLHQLGRRPSVLLHSCCAPCSSAVLERLRNLCDLTLFYYNPNIATEEEFNHRLSELKRLTAEMCPEVKVEAPPYRHEEFLEKVRGLEQEPERGRRCSVCFGLRLQKTAEYAARTRQFDYFCTTLTISPLKDEQLLNQIGEKIGSELGVSFLPSDFKKKNGFRRSVELSKEYELYRQNFCGCEFSRSLTKESADSTINKESNYNRNEAKLYGE